MAFGGIGAAANLVAAANITPVGRYVADGPNGQVSGTAALNIFWQKTELTADVAPSNANAVSDRQLVQERGQVNRLIIAAAAADLLAIRVGAFAIAAADSGRLVTAVAAANEHGLPANFGKGRGRWTEADVGSIRATIFSANQAAQGAAGQTDLGTVVPPIVFVETGGTGGFGDIQVNFHNRGGQAAPAGSFIELMFVHSTDR